MRIGSLFSGIGGLELGLERAGVGHTVWQVEKDDFCRRVLARHWPDAVRYEDVTTVDWSSVEPVEVLCGGFPCQDISLAGRGAGLAGERSGLWREYLRAIRIVRPRFVVVENVAALLARGLGDVLGDLAASGYDTEWDCIPAAAVGAPHRRDRLFVLAYPQRSGLRLEPEPERRRSGAAVAVGDGAQGHVADPDGVVGSSALACRAEAAEAQPELGGADGRRLGDPDCSPSDAHATPSAPWGPACESGWWSTEPDVGRVVDGVSSRLARAERTNKLRALGNAVVPQVAEVVGRRLLELEGAT